MQSSISLFVSLALILCLGNVQGQKKRQNGETPPTDTDLSQNNKINALIYSQCISALAEYDCKETLGGFWATFVNPSCPIDTYRRPPSFYYPSGNTGYSSKYTLPSTGGGYGNGYPNPTSAKLVTEVEPFLNITDDQLEECIRSHVNKICNGFQDEFWRDTLKKYGSSFCPSKYPRPPSYTPATSSYGMNYGSQGYAALPVQAYPSQTQLSYGTQQSSYGGQQQSYGAQQPSYGAQQQSYGAQQQSYTTPKPSYPTPAAKPYSLFNPSEPFPMPPRAPIYSLIPGIKNDKDIYMIY